MATNRTKEEVIQDLREKIVVLDYTEEEKWALSKFVDTMEELGLSQNKLAERLGSSSSTMSKLFSGSYSNASEKLAELISHFKLKDDSKDGYKVSEFVETSISKKVWDLTRECHEDGDLCTISGDPGIGKTATLMQYVKEHPSNTIMTTCIGRGDETRKIMETIAKSLGVEVKSISKMHDDIVNKIKDGTLLIVDEAQHVEDGCVEVLRSISDAVEKLDKTVGILFVGNNLTISKLKKGGEMQAQIESRLGVAIELQGKDITKNDIVLVFPFLREPERRLELELIYRIATNKIQGIRGANKLYRKAYRRAKRQDKQVDYNFLIEVAKDIGLKV